MLLHALLLKFSGSKYHVSLPGLKQLLLSARKSFSRWLSNRFKRTSAMRMERAIVRATCGRKVVDKKTTKEQMGIHRLKETIDGLAKASGVRWQG